MKQKEYANATKYYLLARRILGRYEHISSFKVRLDVEEELDWIRADIVVFAVDDSNGGRENHAAT